MNSSVAVIVLCGRERDQWINPALMMRMVECLQDGLQARRPVAVGLKCGVRPVEKARNEIVKEFLQSPCSWLIQIDNDTVPPANFLKLVDAAEHDGKFVFGVPTPTITPAGPAWNIGRKNNKLCNFATTLPKGWNNCDFVGAAFLAVHRQVFEALKTDWFNPTPINSEDFAFCERARNAGFQPWFQGDVQCDHFHTLSMLSIMEKTCESYFQVAVNGTPKTR